MKLYKDKIKIFVNGQLIDMKKIKYKTLNINKTITTYNAKITFMLKKDELKNFDCGAELMIKHQEYILFSGLIYNLDYKYVRNGLYNVSLEAETYEILLQHILIPFVDIEEIIEPEMNKAENIFLNYFNKHLKPLEFVAKEIQTNLTIEELDELDENITLKDLFDKLAEVTRSNYYINSKKEFTVYRGIPGAKTHTETIKDNKFLEDGLTINKTIQDYASVIKVIGGEPNPGVEIDEEYLTEDGKIWWEAENADEIERLKNIIPGSDGKFYLKDENDKLDTLELVKQHCNSLLNKYSKMPLTFQFKYFTDEDFPITDIIEAGDFIKLSPDIFDLENNMIDPTDGVCYLCADEVTIEDNAGDYFKITLNCSRRKDNTPYAQLEDLIGGKPAKPQGSGNNQNDSNLIQNDVNVQINTTITTDVSFKLYEGEEIPE